MVHAIAVIGAGAVGLHSAIELLKSGWDVTVIEEHGEVGKPVQCAGLISKSGAEIRRTAFLINTLPPKNLRLIV